MPETAKQIIDLDPKQFKMNDYDNVRITMPAKPAMTAEDIDAQLFQYVVSGGKKIKSIADLDDDWVKANFDMYETIDEVRQAIKDQYDHDMEFEMSDLKFRVCCDALLARLDGEVPADILNHNIEVVREGNAERLKEMHISMEQYLREEHLTPEQYDQKLHDETLYQMRLNVAIDIMADVLGMQVGNHELTEYLSAPDPEAFIAEIREKGQVENARRAAVRVKTMRRVVDTAIVREEGAPEQSEEPKKKMPVIVDEDELNMITIDNMPPTQIRDDGATPSGFRILSE